MGGLVANRGVPDQTTGRSTGLGGLPCHHEGDNAPVPAPNCCVSVQFTARDP